MVISGHQRRFLAGKCRLTGRWLLNFSILGREKIPILENRRRPARPIGYQFQQYDASLYPAYCALLNFDANDIDEAVGLRPKQR